MKNEIEKLISIEFILVMLLGSAMKQKLLT